MVDYEYVFEKLSKDKNMKKLSELAEGDRSSVKIKDGDIEFELCTNAGVITLALTGKLYKELRDLSEVIPVRVYENFGFCSAGAMLHNITKFVAESIELAEEGNARKKFLDKERKLKESSVLHVMR